MNPKGFPLRRNGPVLPACDASASRPNECEVEANFHEALARATFRRTPMNLKEDRQVCIRLDSESAAVVLLSVTAKRVHARDLDGDHGNRRRITLWNFGREPQDQPFSGSTRMPKPRFYAGFFERFSSSLHSEGLECGAEWIRTLVYGPSP